MMLVTLEQASAHLRRDTDADDLDLTLKIQAASAAVMNYLQDGSAEFTDSNGDLILDSAGDATLVPSDVQAATLLLIADFYGNREPTASDIVPVEFGYGYLPRAVISLLYHYRTPTLA